MHKIFIISQSLCNFALCTQGVNLSKLKKMSIKKKYNDILASLPSSVTLVAVSKQKPHSSIMQAYEAGARDFGENRHPELIEKHEALPKDIRWHFIGHMQTKKCKYIVPIASMIHSVDTPSLIEAIDKQAKKCDKHIDILLQIHISPDQTKSGFSVDEFREYINSGNWQELTNTRLRGVMAMGSHYADDNELKLEFEAVYSLFGEAKKAINLDYFDTISMGMSDDYPLAVECGSTMVRIGSTIFAQ